MKHSVGDMWVYVYMLCNSMDMEYTKSMHKQLELTN